MKQKKYTVENEKHLVETRGTETEEIEKDIRIDLPKTENQKQQQQQEQKQKKQAEKQKHGK